LQCDPDEAAFPALPYPVSKFKMEFDDMLQSFISQSDAIAKNIPNVLFEISQTYYADCFRNLLFQKP
jgi:hypothetical protein